MVKTVFCDDDVTVLSEMQVLFDRYSKERNQEIVYMAFRRPVELERGGRFDMLFLDIFMPGKTGSRPRRRSGSMTAVSRSFLTSAPKFAVMSYQVDAFFASSSPCAGRAFPV